MNAAPVRDAAVRALPPCPVCGAWRGDPCRTPNGRTRPPHAKRSHAKIYGGKMSMTDVDLWGQIAEWKHERGECDECNCQFCEAEMLEEMGCCDICRDPVELDSDGVEQNTCKSCWSFEVVGLDEEAP